MKTFEEFREIAEGKYKAPDIKAAAKLLLKITNLAIKIQRSKDTSEQIKMIGVQNGYIACMLSLNVEVDAK